MAASWRELIEIELSKNLEGWADVIACTLTDDELDVRFDDGFSKGLPFTLWSGNRVYFPAGYDSTQWVASVSRNPNGEKTDHIGQW